MNHSSSETTTTASPIPISPFSSNYSNSEPTSDELPDLGAFNIVLREWNYLQPPPRIVPLTTITTGTIATTTTMTTNPLDSESGTGMLQEGSTVWSHRPIASYLNLLTPTPTTEDSPSPVEPLLSEDTEGAQTVEIDDFSLSSSGLDPDDDDDENDAVAEPEELVEQPSLGGLDEALSFIAAERAKVAAQREAGTANITKRLTVGSRTRKRVFKPKPTYDDITTIATTTGTTTSSHTYDSFSSSSDQLERRPQTVKSTPSTPPQGRMVILRSKRNKVGLGLAHSRSTPILRSPATTTGSAISIPNSTTQSGQPYVPASDSNEERARLFSLAKKMQKMFPRDRPALSRIAGRISKGIHSGNQRTSLDAEELRERREEKELIDVRGREWREGDNLVHVFIDHSNILIGLLSYLRKHGAPNPNLRQRPRLPPPPPTTASSPENMTNPYGPRPTANPVQGDLAQNSWKRPTKYLSHTALTLILERGRPVCRRVLVASSPLHQSLGIMERLGYETRVYVRVPDLGDGMDRINHNTRGHKRRHSTGKPGHTRGASGNTSTESVGEGTSRKGALATGFRFGGGSAPAPESVAGGSRDIPARPNPNPSVTTSSASAGVGIEAATHNTPDGAPQSAPTSGRVRYREQGVDELLQLKLHQALAATDVVPKGGTIVLATGDGNVGQFDDDGFLGPIRTALKRGWKVELYAWEEGLSRAWKREFGDGSEWGTRGMFKVIGMEQFAVALVEGGWTDRAM